VTRRAAVELAPAVWRIPTSLGNMINSYAFREPDGTITLVDVGLRWIGARRIRAGLAAIGARPGDVGRIVVTHAHVDHVGSLARVVADTGAEVVAHEREAPYLRDGRTPRAVKKKPSRIPAVAVAGQFLDGALLPVAGGLRVVHTPGHTPGHVSLLHEPTGVLVTGDALFNVRAISYGLSRFCTDPALNRTSADALGDLDFEVAAFTHGPEIRVGAREAVRAFLRGRER